MSNSSPRVRVVIVNYNGGAMTLRSLRALRLVDWPAGSLEVVLVDNASTDGVAASVRAEMPWVEVIVSADNIGFAGGCNLALDDLAAVDYVALLNSDAFPERDWLHPLVDALESDSRLGAANSKIVFAPSFVTLTIESPMEGNALTGLELDGHDVWDDAQFGAGCDTTATRGSGGRHSCRIARYAEIRVPTDPEGPVPAGVVVALDASTSAPVQLRAGGDVVVTRRSGSTSSSVPIGGPRFDVINNAGSLLVAGGFGADRGFLEQDRGQFDSSDEVFAWCGAAVLLSARYLEAVGTFDASYFMYYEDTDLAWRGRLAGWRYVYVPRSRVRHVHAASSGEGSALFDHYVERNRLLTLTRNAPWPMVRGAVYLSARHVVGLLVREALVPAARGRRPSVARASRRMRSFGEFVRMTPGALLARRRQRASRVERTELVERWLR